MTLTHLNFTSRGKQDKDSQDNMLRGSIEKVVIHILKLWHQILRKTITPSVSYITLFASLAIFLTGYYYVQELRTHQCEIRTVN